MKLTVIGLGKMGSSLLQGILESGKVDPEQIIGCDIKVDEGEDNDNYWGIHTTNDNKKGAVEADIIILAVKPQIIDKVLAEIKDYCRDKLIISIAAGISSKYLAHNLASSARIIRVMPNTPALVKEGVSAISPGPGATDRDIKTSKKMLESIGEVVEIDEKQMDAVTGLSGSGPAYIYMVIEALADGGVLMGLSRETALKLAAQTVLGSAKMVMETGKHPGELKDMVASPAGTTIEAIKTLEEKGMRSSLIEAVKASAEKSMNLKNG